MSSEADGKFRFFVWYQLEGISVKEISGSCKLQGAAEIIRVAAQR
jgi:hypothetical protein